MLELKLLVIRIGENNLHRVEHKERIRSLQDRSLKQGLTGFTSFIAWPVQLENNSFGSLSLIILIKNSLDLGPAIAKAPN